LVLFSGLPGERESVSPTPALEAGSAEGERAALPTSTPLPATDIPPAPEAGTEHTPEEAVSEATPPSTAIEPPPEVAQTNPTATILNPTGYRVVFFYSERSFYMWNPGDRRLSISSIAFEALDDATGQAAPYRYEGDLWAAYYDQLMEGNCNALEIAELAAPVRPPQCPAYNAVRSPAASSPWIFWQAREEISQFRVLWEGVEIGRCEISLETCEVYLP
jgi:hypothetical protein